MQREDIREGVKLVRLTVYSMLVMQLVMSVTYSQLRDLKGVSNWWVRLG